MSPAKSNPVAPVFTGSPTRSELQSTPEWTMHAVAILRLKKRSKSFTNCTAVHEGSPYPHGATRPRSNSRLYQPGKSDDRFTFRRSSYRTRARTGRPSLCRKRNRRTGRASYCCASFALLDLLHHHSRRDPHYPSSSYIAPSAAWLGPIAFTCTTPHRSAAALHRARTDTAGSAALRRGRP